MISDGVYAGRMDQGLSLLLTCKKIYEEAAAVLYTQNTFSFDSPLALSTFAQKVLPSRLNSIRSITFERHNVPAADWNRICKILTEIQGLVEFRVSFQESAHALKGVPEEELFGPLETLQERLPVFEVESHGKRGDKRKRWENGRLCEP